MDLIKKARNLQLKIERRIKSKTKPPFGEWRLPLMVLTISSLIFILITTMFGVTINTNSREIDFRIGIEEYGNDPDEYDPMIQYPDWIYVCLIAGYFFSLCLFVHFWFEYMKWKWKNIKQEEKKCILKKD